MNSRPPQISKWRTAGLLKIVREPTPRELFADLMRSMQSLPLTPFDLAEFLKLVGYHEICDKEPSDDDLPFIIAQLQRFLSKSAEELLEILSWLQAREWPSLKLSHLGPVLKASEPPNVPSVPPIFRIPSCHGPPAQFDWFIVDYWQRLD